MTAKSGKKKPTTDPGGRCGTYPGYNAHARRGETACAACKRANAERTRNRRQESRGKTTPARAAAAEQVDLTALPDPEPRQDSASVPDRDPALPDGVPDPPSHLKRRGRALWESVNRRYLLTEASLEVLVETCRIADRLERFADALAARSTLWFELGDPDTWELTADGKDVNIVVNGMIGEARQLQTVLRQNLDKLGIVGVMEREVETEQKESLMDELARKRRERLEREGTGS